MAETRRLATILSLDVAGYSRAAERDDAAAAEAVRRVRAMIAEVATPFGGRIFSSAGDGFMLEFPAATAGVQAALALLKESASGAQPRPQVRIGLHLGEVMVEANGDLLGHGVNVAARLQSQ
jgi:adenylate cyclase